MRAYQVIPLRREHSDGVLFGFDPHQGIDFPLIAQGPAAAVSRLTPFEKPFSPSGGDHNRGIYTGCFSQHPSKPAETTIYFAKLCVRVWSGGHATVVTEGAAGL